MNIKKVASILGGLFFTILALAMYKRHMSCNDFENANEQKTNQKLNDQASDATQDGVRKEYFLALAPAYLIGSYYFIQATLKSTTVHLLWFSYTLPPEMKYINIGLSILLLLWAVVLCYLAFWKIPKLSKDSAYQLVARFSGLTLIFFMYDWIKNLVEVIKLDIGLWYFYLFSCCGIIVIVALVVYPYGTLALRLRKKIKSS